MNSAPAVVSELLSVSKYIIISNQCVKVNI